MIKTTFSELRQNTKYFIDAVEQQHEHVIIFRHGQAVAQLVPISGLHYQPSWKRKGLKLTIKGGSISQEILKEREEGSE